MTLTTDALLTGWGAHVGSCTIRGLWSTDEARMHINWLELKTILLALTSFFHVLKGHAVAIHSDNTMAVSYVNKQGGTVS